MTIDEVEEAKLLSITLDDEVEEAKLLSITLDGQLSCSNHIDKVVMKIGRCMSVIKRCSSFMRQKSTVLVKALVLSHFDYCL